MLFRLSSFTSFGFVLLTLDAFIKRMASSKSSRSTRWENRARAWAFRRTAGGCRSDYDPSSQVGGRETWPEGWIFFWLKEIKLEINLFCLMKNAHTTLDMPTNPTQKSAWVHKASAIWHYCPSHKKRVEIKMVELQMGLQMWKLKTGTVGHWIAWNLTL